MSKIDLIFPVYKMKYGGITLRCIAPEDVPLIWIWFNEIVSDKERTYIFLSEFMGLSDRKIRWIYKSNLDFLNLTMQDFVQFMQSTRF